ncbi:DUF1499 domain-containing protein [Alkalicoccobacillus plakortidis]|uniref:DUF1499 domain-containing protein n=1 Tax=Alkalicoccobacillus plakortidis TaxID=444060 RepID=A0ABT0XIS5_9BACI|nr:DUF1499 domain-containing protein [Alkalicoccobacillus plakortidis]MCM2675253.1 DUF1499 domain-containing protein [Alkalicoccobacillus plakortidis]
MGFKDTWHFLTRNHAETGEKHSIEALQTRYYKGNKDKIIEGIEAVVKESGYKLKRTERERGEMIIEQVSGQKFLLVASVITVRPFKTAVDFSCSHSTVLPSDFGKSRKMLVAMYSKLDKQLTFIGSGLGDELL